MLRGHDTCPFAVQEEHIFNKENFEADFTPSDELCGMGQGKFPGGIHRVNTKLHQRIKKRTH